MKLSLLNIIILFSFTIAHSAQAMDEKTRQAATAQFLEAIPKSEITDPQQQERILQQITHYLSEGATIESQKADQHPPLYQAIENNNLWLVKFLERNGAQLNNPKTMYAHALMMAAGGKPLKSNRELIEYVLPRLSKEDIITSVTHEINGYHLQVKHLSQHMQYPENRLYCLAYIIVNGIPEQLNNIGKQSSLVNDGEPILAKIVSNALRDYTTINTWLPCIEVLIKGGAAFDLPYEWKIKSKETRTVEDLLDRKGPKKEASDKIRAIINTRIQEYADVIQETAFPNTQADEISAAIGSYMFDQRARLLELIDTAREDSPKLADKVAMYIKLGDSPDTCNDNDKCVLAYAAQKGFALTSEKLLKLGATIDKQDKSGKNPLMWAAEAGHTEVVELLLHTATPEQRKAMLQTKTVDFYIADPTPGEKFTFAGQQREAQTSSYKFATRSSDAERKKEATAIVEKNPIGQTALHLAAKQCYPDTVKLLLDAGADKSITDGDNKNALYYAQHATIRGDACKECIALLGGTTVKVRE